LDEQHEWRKKRNEERVKFILRWMKKLDEKQE
jgi:hypothetical protein